MEVNERPPSLAEQPERRQTERRRSVLRALFYGSLKPRRRGPRRAGESAASAVSAVDWHHPQWLAIAVLIVAFSCSDGFLTLVLLEDGAYEVNPLMAPLLHNSVVAFALVKIGLTATGVVLLTQLARVRAFGRRLPVGVLLYVVLAIYGALILYEFRLLNRP